MAPETLPLFHAAMIVTVAALGVLVGFGFFEIVALKNEIRRLTDDRQR